MHILMGRFNGTGADVYLSLGAIPYEILVWNLEAPNIRCHWMQSLGGDALSPEGVRFVAAGDATGLTLGTGIQPYYGGEEMITGNQTSVAWGEGIYLSRNDKDYREFTNEAAGILGDATTETITTWTLGSAAAYTGNFNGDITGTNIGAGSMIRIQETAVPRRVYETYLTADPAGAGAEANEVTLAYPVPNGEVRFIGAEFTWTPTAIGRTTSPGILLGDATTNVDNDICMFRAFMPGD